MNKLKLFLIADGVIVVVGMIFFLILFLRKGQNNAFRDDLWAEKKKRAAEDQVDQKILLDHKPDPKDPDEKPSAARAQFRTPNFRGRPHEILGIPQGAARELVMKAYKHWIKRYHPDRVAHLGGNYVEQARRRAEQLNSARDELLKTAK